MSINFPRSSILHAEKPGSRYELSAEKMKGCLNGIFTGEKLKEKRYFVQNSKAVKYAEQVANCNDKAFFVSKFHPPDMNDFGKKYTSRSPLYVASS